MEIPQISVPGVKVSVFEQTDEHVTYEAVSEDGALLALLNGENAVVRLKVSAATIRESQDGLPDVKRFFESVFHDMRMLKPEDVRRINAPFQNQENAE
jgi:hypothetical protein